MRKKSNISSHKKKTRNSFASCANMPEFLNDTIGRGEADSFRGATHQNAIIGETLFELLKVFSEISLKTE